MTEKADFTESDGQIALEGPPTAGMIVLAAERGGTFRETVAIAKAYVEARKHHGESEILVTTDVQVSRRTSRTAAIPSANAQ